MREKTTETKDGLWSATIGWGNEVETVKAIALVRSPSWQQFIGQSCDECAPYATGPLEAGAVSSAS